MHETVTIMRRELKSYFYSPIAYVFGALFLGIVCALGSLGLRHGFQARLGGFFQMLPIVFLFFLPALTMRLWAEERRAGTLELLLTFPVTIRQLIAGKFLASMTYLTLLLALTLGLPLTMSFYGELDWSQVGVTYLASLLLAAAYVSIGMFWSSLTRDQVIAFLACVVTLFLLFFGADLLNYFFSGEVPWLLGGSYTVYVLGALSPKGYFDSISYGVADTGDLVYYVSFCAFFLHANALVLQGKRVKG
jgi:ABC-2 type transport system permease protein